MAITISGFFHFPASEVEPGWGTCDIYNDYQLEVKTKDGADNWSDGILHNTILEIRIYP